MTDWLSNWTDAFKKYVPTNVWQNERFSWSKKTSKKESPQQLQTYNMPTDDVANTNGTN